MRRIHRAQNGSYTMRSELDGAALALAQPPKFSLDDRYARFRYAQRRESWSQHS